MYSYHMGSDDFIFTSNRKPESKCLHCGKKKGNHKATTWHCPFGMKTRVGYTSFHPTQVFEEKIVKSKKVRCKGCNHLVDKEDLEEKNLCAVCNGAEG
jgi:DNA-directed RNA polymerase subunit RPC12/RpoP